MINNSKAKLFCRDDISLIENYNEAIADTENVWVCHHRLELTLDGEFANSAEDLIRHGMYYKRPYFELIWLPKNVHRQMHGIKKALSNNTLKKLSDKQKGINNSMHGKEPWNKGKTGVQVGANIGRKFSKEWREKLSNAHKGKTPWNKGMSGAEYTSHYKDGVRNSKRAKVG